MKNKSFRLRQRGEAEIVWLISIVLLSAWVTHIYVCFSGNRWGFLIAGAMFFPIAIVHGFGIWLGIW